MKTKDELIDELLDLAFAEDIGDGDCTTLCCIPADEMGVTNSPGFFAAGDVRTKKVRQSVTAASDGANAVQSVIDYLKNESFNVKSQISMMR